MRVVLPCAEAMLSSVVARGLQGEGMTDLGSEGEAEGCQEMQGGWGIHYCSLLKTYSHKTCYDGRGATTPRVAILVGQCGFLLGGGSRASVATKRQYRRGLGGLHHAFHPTWFGFHHLLDLDTLAAGADAL